MKIFQLFPAESIFWQADMLGCRREMYLLTDTTSLKTDTALNLFTHMVLNSVILMATVFNVCHLHF